MKLAVYAGLRSSTSWGAHRTLLPALLTALGTIGAVLDSASAQTAFTLPAPPFELPMVPSVSGTWTVMVGVGGEYKPDFEGANRAIVCTENLIRVADVMDSPKLAEWYGPQAEIDAPLAPGSNCSTGSRGILGGHRPILQRQPQYYQPAIELPLAKTLALEAGRLT